MKLEIEIKVESEQSINPVNITIRNTTGKYAIDDEVELAGFLLGFVRVLADQVNEHRRPGESMRSVLERMQRSHFLN